MVVVVRKVIIVSVHVRYFSFFSFFQFMSVRLHQVMSGYVSLHQFMSVYVSLLQFTSVYVHWRDGMWSSTIRSVLKFEAFKKKI